MKKISYLILLITLTTYSQNTPPVAQNQSVSTSKGTVTDITLVATDSDNDILSYVIKTLPTNGVVKNGNSTINQSDLPAYLNSSNVKCNKTNCH